MFVDVFELEDFALSRVTTVYDGSWKRVGNVLLGLDEFGGYVFKSSPGDNGRSTSSSGISEYPDL
jgi:hypothetical protein